MNDMFYCGATSCIPKPVTLKVVWKEDCAWIVLFPAPVQVSVYEVVCRGATDTEPLAPPEVSVPLGEVTLHEVVLVQLHERVDDCGGTIVEGLEENIQTGFS